MAQHSSAFLQKFLLIVCTEEFQRFQWSWPGNHQPLHAIMVLLKKVERDPFGPDAETFREVVDQAIALCTEDGGIGGSEGGSAMLRPLTEGGQEAWNFVRRLHDVAWTKAGLDPDVVMTREDVVWLVTRKGEATTASEMPQLLLPLELTSGNSEATFYAPVDLDGVDSGGGGEANMNFSWDELDSIFGNFEHQSI